LHLVAQAWDSGKQFIGDRRIQWLEDLADLLGFLLFG
jgi:hypothetical protein